MNINTGFIIFVNNDLTNNVQSAIQRQLFINETVDGYEFDQRVLADPNYPQIVRSNNWHLLVVRSFYNLTNQSLADVVIFIKEGLAYVESSKVGPPGQCFRVDSMTLERLLNAQTQPPQMLNGSTSNVQSNILYPMFNNNYVDQYPFGSDPIAVDPDLDGDSD